MHPTDKSLFYIDQFEINLSEESQMLPYNATPISCVDGNMVNATLPYQYVFTDQQPCYFYQQHPYEQLIVQPNQNYGYDQYGHSWNNYITTYEETGTNCNIKKKKTKKIKKQGGSQTSNGSRRNANCSSSDSSRNDKQSKWKYHYEKHETNAKHQDKMQQKSQDPPEQMLVLSVDVQQVLEETNINHQSNLQKLDESIKDKRNVQADHENAEVLSWSTHSVKTHLGTGTSNDKCKGH